jgi:uncharacterized protein (TIGR00369 family)
MRQSRPSAKGKSDIFPAIWDSNGSMCGRASRTAVSKIGKQHLAPNGYLHAAAVVALADTACGYGCVMSLPEGAAGFTTAELKANFIGTALAGGITCEARLLHGGRTTQVWDAEVKSEAIGKTIAVFRCTQILLSKARNA